MGNLKTEFSTPIALAELDSLNKKTGLVVEINDGEIKAAYFENKSGGIKWQSAECLQKQ